MNNSPELIRVYSGAPWGPVGPMGSHGGLFLHPSPTTPKSSNKSLTLRNRVLLKMRRMPRMWNLKIDPSQKWKIRRWLWKTQSRMILPKWESIWTHYNILKTIIEYSGGLSGSWSIKSFQPICSNQTVNIELHGISWLSSLLSTKPLLFQWSLHLSSITSTPTTWWQLSHWLI